MTEYNIDYPLLVLLTGVAILLTMLVKLLCDRMRITPVAGYLVLGFLLRWSDRSLGLLEKGGLEIFHFLAVVGLVALLFRVGLESQLARLFKQLGRAGVIWVFNIAGSGLLGFYVAYLMLDIDFTGSLVIGCAMTATSVGISVGVWQEEQVLHKKTGDLLLDVAELDDISAILLMGLLFSVLPLLQAPEAILFEKLAFSTAVFTGKLLLFGVICYLFSIFTEHPVVTFFRKNEKPPVAMLAVLGLGFIIAALAGQLGFSLAIGAFFAGLVFSRDPEAVRMEAYFLPLYNFFSPFFFIGVGLDIDPALLGDGVGIGLVLLVVAIVGKVVTNALPMLAYSSGMTALIVGLSMVPRAEITMLISQHGLKKGYISGEVFAAMAIVSALTCIVAPLAVKPLLVKWPPP